MKIMLIDDEFECTVGLAGAIEPAGYSCEIFTEPEKAVAAYPLKHYDVVISDMRMPGMNGIQVLIAIRKMNPDARVIIITGYGDVETAMAAINNGAHAFFGKPVDVADLMETLDKIKNEHAARNRTREEQERLATEYIRLKKAYGELQLLLQEKELRRNGV